jgi:HNH endonuclease
VVNLVHAEVLRDISCRITTHCNGTQSAYLVPTSEGVWFIDNEMGNYGMRSESINDVGNLILLRSDIHSIFDARTFAIVPKRSNAPNGKLSKSRLMRKSRLMLISVKLCKSRILVQVNTTRQRLLVKAACSACPACPSHGYLSNSSQAKRSKSC